MQKQHIKSDNFFGMTFITPVFDINVQKKKSTRFFSLRFYFSALICVSGIIRICNIDPVYINRTWQTCKWLTLESFNGIYNKKSWCWMWPGDHSSVTAAGALIDHFEKEITIHKNFSIVQKGRLKCTEKTRAANTHDNPDDSSSLNRNLQSGNIVVITRSIKDTNESGIENVDKLSISLIIQQQSGSV